MPRKNDKTQSSARDDKLEALDHHDQTTGGADPGLNGVVNAAGGEQALPPVDQITGEPVEKPLPESAAPPPSMPEKIQKTGRKLDLDGIRQARTQVVPQVSEAVRIPVTTSPRSDAFLRAHPTLGGLNDQMPVWVRGGVGKGGGLRLIHPSLTDYIRAHGGKVSMCAIYWCQYSTGGQTLVVVNAESDNDWIVATRKILELCRTQWLKRINAGNCWDKKEPPAPIPDPSWMKVDSFDDVLELGWDEVITSRSHPEVLSLVYGGNPSAAKE
jgi:hypothetical protein